MIMIKVSTCSTRMFTLMLTIISVYYACTTLAEQINVDKHFFFAFVNPN